MLFYLVSFFWSVTYYAVLLHCFLYSILYCLYHYFLQYLHSHNANMQNIAQINTKYIDNRLLHTSFSIFLHIRPSALRHVPLFLIFVVFFPCFHFVLCNSITANSSCKKVMQIYITQYGWLGNSIASVMVIFIASRQT